MIDPIRPTLITGDFNVCLLKHPKNIITKTLSEFGYKQLIKEATHVLGGHIDHTNWRDPTDEMGDPWIETYSPYYSDHDIITVILR